jgi:hypothetical protein
MRCFFFTQVYRGSKFCPSVLEIVGLRVPVRYIGDFTLFSACSSSRYCPSARCASAANVVCRATDVFGAKPVLLNSHFMNLIITIILVLL